MELLISFKLPLRALSLPDPRFPIVDHGRKRGGMSYDQQKEGGPSSTGVPRSARRGTQKHGCVSMVRSRSPPDTLLDGQSPCTSSDWAWQAEGAVIYPGTAGILIDAGERTPRLLSVQYITNITVVHF